LVSEKTPADYISHLKARNYHYIVAGKEKVDLRSAIEQLRKNFKINKILTDTGRILGNLLIERGMVNEISLLFHPVIIGEKGYPMFSDLKKYLNLKLIKSEQLENGCVWMVYTP